jgi:hypothetical protein
MGKVSSKAGSLSASATISSGDTLRLGWPPASLRATKLMVLLFARELRIHDALHVIERIRSRGMPSTEEVPFGVVVSSPNVPDQPLTVLPPPPPPLPPAQLS